MRPGLVVSDLDGTLLDPGGALSSGNLMAASELAAAGVPLILATGRSYYESRFVLDAIPSCPLVIGAAGALLSHAGTGETLDRELLEVDLIESITRLILEEGHLVQLLQDRSATEEDYLLVGTAAPHPTMDWWLELHDLASHRVESLEEVDLSHTVRIGVVGGPSELEALTERIRAAYHDRLVIRHWQGVSERDDRPTYLLELFGHGVDKWSMIRKVMDQRGLVPGEVVAIGDGLNDIQMLKEAGLGIAMGQANDRVKAVADRVVSGNHEDGFAEAIRGVLGS